MANGAMHPAQHGQSVHPFPRPAQQAMPAPANHAGAQAQPIQTPPPQARPQKGNANQQNKKRQQNKAKNSKADPISKDDRTLEIAQIQRKIARQRKRKTAQLIARLSFFVVLPTLFAGYYFYHVATPLYATQTEFVVQNVDDNASAPAAPAGGAAMLGGMSPMGSAQENIYVQRFLENMPAMIRLNNDQGFHAHFSSPDIDPLNRLAPDATLEDIFKMYLRQLDVGFDPAEGVIRMEIRAADPQTSYNFAQALQDYAEDSIHEMSEDLRQTRIAGAQSNFEAANESVIAARNRVVELQESGGLISAETEIASIQSRIETLESDILRQELRLQEITSSPQPNATRVRVIEENIQRMQDTIAQLRSTLTENQSFDESLARTQVELVAAQNELQLRQEMRSQALQALETARIEANRQALYIVQTVEPVLAETAAYPKSFENTLAAFLVFLGIYLAFSITASVLREQISQ